MMKIFKGKEQSEREREENISEAAKGVPDTDAWYLFKFFDMNTRRWSPVYAAFSYTAACDEMTDLIKKQPKRAFYMKGVGLLRGAEFEAVESRAVYIGEQYENIG